MQKPAFDKIHHSTAWDNYIRTGETRSLELLYNYYFGLLYKYGRSFTKEDHLIEDGIHNVFLMIMRSRKHMGSITNPQAYLLRSFRNELISLMKKTKRNSYYADTDTNFPMIDTDPEEKMIRLEEKDDMKSLLRKATSKLTSSQQEIILMRYSLGLSYTEISETLKISIDSCRTAIYRALKTIRSNYK